MQNIGKPKYLRDINKIRILNIIKNLDTFEIKDVEKEINLSSTTVKKIITSLVENSQVLELGYGNSTLEGGKKPKIYTFNENLKLNISIELFPGKISGSIFDLRGKVLYENFNKIAKDESFDSTLDIVSRTIDELIEFKKLKDKDLFKVGISIYGIANYHKGIFIYSPYFKNWGLNLNFVDKLKSKLNRNIEIFIDNNCRFEVCAEKAYGIAKDFDNIMYINYSAGIIVKGKLKRGVNYLAGEIGHMIVDTNGKSCVCGGRGCFQTTIEADSIIDNFKEQYLKMEKAGELKYVNSVDMDLDTLTLMDIFKLSNNGNELARITMDNAAYWFGLCIANMILVHDPQIIIIGGIYSQAGDYFINKLKEYYNGFSLKALDKKVEIKYAMIKENITRSGIIAFILDQYSNMIWEDKQENQLSNSM